MKKNLVLVTGGAGFIGSHVADLLVAQDYDVAVVDNLSSGSRNNLNPHVEFFQLDIRSPEMYELLGHLKPMAICHLAALNGDGTQTRDFVYVEDVARSNLLALESGYCGELNIGTALETDINHLFYLLKNITGSSMAECHGPAKPGEQKRSVIDYSRAHQILNWEPLTPLEKGLTQTVNYFRQI